MVITGDGKREFQIFGEICKKYNGNEKLIWFPGRTIVRKTGLSALDTLKHIPGDIHINNIIYTVDADQFEENQNQRILDKLTSIGISIDDEIPIGDTLLLKCSIGSHRILLYCVVIGITTCIEENLAQLIRLKFRRNIDLTGIRDSAWKNNLKNEIRHFLNQRGLSYNTLIEESSIHYIERAFPNICSVIKRIEENF
jgi:hypothetical protein